MSRPDATTAGLMTLALAGMLALALAPGARAETVEASSTTLVSGRQDPRDGVLHTAVPVFEMVSLRASDFRLPGVDDMAVLVSGWGTVALADPPVRDGDGKRAQGDLDIAFVEAKALRRRIGARLGRQLIIAGAGRNLGFDGLTLTVRPIRWVGATAQAGVPVTPRFAADRGDALIAARAFVKPAFDGEAGVSFLQVLDNGQIARRDLAVDARLVPLSWLPLSLSGFALWSLPEQRLGEGNLTATWQIERRFQISGDYRRSAPDLFLPRNSIFSVFSQETRDEAGGYLYARPLPRVRLQGDYHVIVDAAGTGHDASLKLTGTLGGDGRTLAGVESRVLAPPGNGYTLARAFAQVRATPLLTATADTSAFFFTENVNGQRRSFVGAATLGYDFLPRWRALVTGIGSVTPFAERSFEGMVKVAYRLTTQVRQVTP